MKGTSDSISSSLQPEVRSLLPVLQIFPLTNPSTLQSQKSTSQQAGDTLSGNQNENKV